MVYDSEERRPGEPSRLRAAGARVQATAAIDAAALARMLPFQADAECGLSYLDTNRHWTREVTALPNTDSRVERRLGRVPPQHRTRSAHEIAPRPPLPPSGARVSDERDSPRIPASKTTSPNGWNCAAQSYRRWFGELVAVRCSARDRPLVPKPGGTAA